MSSIMGFIAGLLTAALSLLGFVQQHPEFPQASKDQAQLIAQQAITQATQTLATVPAPVNKMSATISFAAGVLMTRSLTPTISGRASGVARIHVTITLPTAANALVISEGDVTLKSTYKDESAWSYTQSQEFGYSDTREEYQIKLTGFDTNGHVVASANGTLVYDPTFDPLTVERPNNTPVPGMSKYTNADFGFSFWYPSDWKLESRQTTKASGTYFPGGTVTKSYNLMDSSSNFAVSISTVYSAGMSITDTGGAGPLGPIRYYFDKNNHTWMMDCPEGCPDGSSSPKPANTDQNTMGGLHMFAGTSRFDATIIPLSAHDFVFVIDGGGFNARSLANTVVATDPGGATPGSTQEQIAAIQAEAGAYGVSAAKNSVSYTSKSAPIRVSLPSDFTAAENITADQKDRTTTYMGISCDKSAICLYYTGPEIGAVEGAAFALRSSADATYEDCISEVQKDTSKLTIGGVTWLKNQTGDAGLGHRLSEDTYRTYYNGACYEAYASIAWNVGTGGGPDQTKFQDLQNELDFIAQSMQFTVANTAAVKHAAAVPAWKTYNSSASSPFAFTYPGSFLLYEEVASQYGGEVDVGPGSKSGLDTNQSSIAPGSISVQMTPFASHAQALSHLQDELKNDPVGYPGFAYVPIKIGGEDAETTSGTTGSSAIHVVHDNNEYRIILWNPLLPDEYQTFLTSFRFTN